MSVISADDWLKSTVESLEEVVNSYFDVSTLSPAMFDDDVERPTCGAIIGLVSGENSVQIFLVASHSGAEGLGKGLLGFEPDEEIEMSDVGDAMGEIVNIVAGMIKTALNDQDSNLNLSLPTFVQGKLEPLGGQIASHQVLMMGPIETKVLVINSSQEASAKAKSRVSAA